MEVIQRIINYNPAIILAALSLFSHIILLFYNKELYDKYFLLNTFVSYFIVLVFIILGLLLCRSIGFKLPFSNNKHGKLKPALQVSIGAGILLGLFVFTIFLLSPEYLNHISVTAVEDPSLLILILVSIQAGINEEIIFRLFGMSLTIWILMRVFKQLSASNIVMLSSIFLIGLLFAAAHLLNIPQNISSTVILFSMVINLIGAFLFGILYWKKGLESAMIAHIFTDITLQLCLFIYI